MGEKNEVNKSQCHELHKVNKDNFDASYDEAKAIIEGIIHEIEDDINWDMLEKKFEVDIKNKEALKKHVMVNGEVDTDALVKGCLYFEHHVMEVLEEHHKAGSGSESEAESEGEE